MSESITKSFLTQGVAVVTIAVSSIIGFNYLADRNEKSFEKALMPFIEEFKAYKIKATENRTLILENTKDIDNTMLSVNIFIDYYNRKYHKEFLRPIDVEEQTYKRRK